MRVLITAGNTREKIDDVRDWGNIFTGNTGLAIAKSVADVADVDLLTSNQQHLREIKEGQHWTAHPINASAFTSHAELRCAPAALMARFKYDAIYMTAAVADYSPSGAFVVLDRKPGDRAGEEHWIVRDAHASKIKSSHNELAILGKQTEKIIDLFRKEWGHEGLLIKFKLEVGITKDELIRIGRLSRKASDANYLVANTLDMVSGAAAGGYLISENGEEWVPRPELAVRMRELLF